MSKKYETYRINSQVVPSVTTLLNVLSKPALIPWASKMAVEYMQENLEAGRKYGRAELIGLFDQAKKAYALNRDSAGDFGSTVHSIIEAHIISQEVKVEDKFLTIYENFKKVTEGYQWLDSEIVVLNPYLGYGGTADALAIVDNTLTLVDIKTSSGVYPEHSLQLAMYRQATPQNESLREKWHMINQCIILHLDKDRLTWEELYRDTESHIPVIPALVQLYHWQKGTRA